MVYIYKKIINFAKQKNLWQRVLFLYSTLCIFFTYLIFNKNSVNYKKQNSLVIYVLSKKQNSELIKNGLKDEIISLLNTIDMSNLNTFEIMNLLLLNLNYVNLVKIYRGLKGEIIIAVKMRKPIVLIYDSTKNMMSYLDKNCNSFHKPSFFVCKVPLLQIKINLEQLNYEQKKNLFDFLYAIKKDPLLRADISSICLNETKKIIVYTVSEKKIVNFGSMHNLNEKLNKLRIYYTHILPSKGFNYYDKVELSFKNQILCE